MTVAALLFAFGQSSVAHAHLGHEVQTAERYLKVDFSDDHVRIVVSLMLGPLEARRILMVADRDSGDGDGQLSPGEADAYMARWGEGLVTDLPVELDGRAIAVRWEEAFLDPTGPISARPATVEMVARVPLSGGQHRLTLRDRMRRETFDRTDVAFRAREGAELVAGGAGEAPQDRVAALAFAADQGPDVLTAVADVPGASADALPERENGASPWLWLGAALGLALGVVGVAAFRRRRPGRPS